MTHLTDADRTQITNALKRAVNGREGWDLPPELGHIYRLPNGRMSTRTMAIPPAMWDRYGHPANLLGSYRSLLASPRGANQRNAAAAIRAAAPDTLMGMFVLVEGWAPPKLKARAMHEASQRGEPQPRFKDMPDRIEVRTATAVDRDGTIYMITQHRPDMFLEDLVDSLDNPHGVSGRMPELLFGLTHLLLPKQHA